MIIENYETFITTTLINTERENMTELLKEMKKGGFFSSPCSAKFHLCEAGGLAEHSINVYRTAKELNAALRANIPEDTIAIVSLLHDLGKMGDYNKPNYVENILKSGKQSEAEPYKSNKELLYIPHEVRSIAIAERFIKLTEEEEQAILYHNGLYGDFKYDINGKETPLYMILHFADLWACRAIETNKEGGKS